MKKQTFLKKALLLGALTFGVFGYSQVGIGTSSPNESAMLDIVSRDQGVLIPQIALTSLLDSKTISNGNVESLLVYNTTTTGDVIPGYYYWYANSWRRIMVSDEINLPSNIVIWNDMTNEFTYVDDSGVWQIIDIQELVEFEETLTTLSVNEETGTLDYMDEDGELNAVILDSLVVSGILNNVTTIFNDTLVTQEISNIIANDTLISNEIINIVKAEETLTTLSVNEETGTLDYTDEDGELNAVILDSLVISGIVNNASTIFSDNNVIQEVTDIAAVQQPWFSTVTNTGATSNTDSIYSLGWVGIGTAIVPTGDARERVKLTVDGYINITGTGKSIFIGQDVGLNDELSGNRNLGIGYQVFVNNVGGVHNVALGGLNSLTRNTHGNRNVAVGGESSLYLNTEGTNNIAIGGQNSLYNNRTGNYNVAVGGKSSLKNNYDGTRNVAVGGFESLMNNGDGDNNVAVGGENSLSANTSGNRNVAVGGQNSLSANTSGTNNVAIGGQNSLSLNTEGNSNVAVGGVSSLKNNESGTHNVAVGGVNSLSANTTGLRNVAIGGESSLSANTTGNSNVAIGGQSSLAKNTTGSNNIAIGGGLQNVTTGSNNIGIGIGANVDSSTASNQIRMGNEDITSADIQVAWSVTSDKRWKNNIRTLPYGLDMVMQLKPVDYMRDNDDSGKREIGFIAQDLDMVVKELEYTDQGFLTTDDNGFYSVRYNDFIALLTKAIQEQQDIIHEQQDEIERLQVIMAAFESRLSALE